MGHKRQTLIKNTDIISASEIGQYHYCSIAWYLQRCGYEPKSPLLDIGIKKHVELGEVIDYTRTNIRKSKLFAIVGYLLLIATVLIIIFEVIL